MADILDYMDWRGDIRLENDEFNRVDALIFTQLAYIEFGNILSFTETKTLKEAATAYLRKNKNETVISSIAERSNRVLMKAYKSERFSDLKLMYYRSEYDTNSPLQFGAVTFLLNEKTVFVAFRGTDDTLIGWEEDFRLCYTMPVDAQLKAKDYLAEVMQNFDGEVFVGGHSKGGNLAVYAAMMQEESLIPRFIKIYNFDGPGFMQEIIEGEQYARIKDVTKSYMPQGSIVGMIMFHENEKYEVVQSSEKGFKQHVAISWQILGRDFIQAEEFDNSSILFRKACKKWLNDIDKFEREQFINIIFQILKSGEHETVSELTGDFFKSMNTIIKSYKGLDKTTRQMIKGTIKQMIKLSTETISENRSATRKIAEKNS